MHHADSHTDQTYAFWRPHAPPGFAVLGDYLTPLSVKILKFFFFLVRQMLLLTTDLNVNMMCLLNRDKPPTKGVLAVNTNSITVKRPTNFRLIWPPLISVGIKGEEMDNSDLSWKTEADGSCSIWFPEAPKGYVALGCIVTHGRTPPPLSSALCIPSSSVSPCSLRDCIIVGTPDM